jgi:hypothetical protein
VKIRTEKKSLEMRAILGKNLKEPPKDVLVLINEEMPPAILYFFKDFIYN